MNLKISRRSIIKGLIGLLGSVGILSYFKLNQGNKNMIKKQFALDFQWKTQEPFLFCVHHDDHYPMGTSDFGPDKAHHTGRDMGQDFQIKDGFRMYHGEVVPGFPVHPHRGFETITIVRKGFVDHSDSMGAAGRYGEGDVQWMTAGSGVQHSEMFPLIKKDANNRLELFQIWLNLPKKSKMTKPHFTMFWSEKIPLISLNNKTVQLSLIAGSWQDVQALPPPPDSWASHEDSEIAVWLVKMKKGSEFTIPETRQAASRTLYFFDGDALNLNNIKINSKSGLELDSQFSASIKADYSDIEFLMLQAKPLGEPIVQHGPFVMNSKEEIIQTIQDYQKNQFGGWPWPVAEMVHGDKLERFAKFPDGRVEKPNS